MGNLVGLKDTQKHSINRQSAQNKSKRSKDRAQDTSKAPKMDPWNLPGLPKGSQKTPWPPKWTQTDRLTERQSYEQSDRPNPQLSTTIELNLTSIELDSVSLELNSKSIDSHSN